MGDEHWTAPAFTNLGRAVGQTFEIWNKRRHRGDRVVRIGTPPPPLPQPLTSVFPPPPLVPRGGTHSLGERGWGGVPIRTRGQTLWYSRYICTLWAEMSCFKSCLSETTWSLVYMCFLLYGHTVYKGGAETVHSWTVWRIRSAEMSYSNGF